MKEDTITIELKWHYQFHNRTKAYKKHIHKDFNKRYPGKKQHTHRRNHFNKLLTVKTLTHPIRNNEVYDGIYIITFYRRAGLQTS